MNGDPIVRRQFCLTLDRQISSSLLSTMETRRFRSLTGTCLVATGWLVGQERFYNRPEPVRSWYCKFVSFTGVRMSASGRPTPLDTCQSGAGAPHQKGPIVGPPPKTTQLITTHLDVLLAACSHESVYLVTMILIILIRITKQVLNFNNVSVEY
jgi:hypothetical protein